MVHSSILALVGLLGLALVVANPIPTTFSQLNYVQPGPGSFHYTVIHPPHPQHKFYTVPLAYTKPLYIYNPFQHQFLFVDNNLHLQIPSVAVADAKVPVPNQELAVPAPGEDADKAKLETPVGAEVSEDDTVAVDSADKQPEGREDADRGEESKEVVVEKAGGDEEDLEGGPSPKGSSESEGEKAVGSLGSEGEKPEKIETGSDTVKEEGEDAPKNADYAAGDDVEDE